MKAHELNITANAYKQTSSAAKNSATSPQIPISEQALRYDKVEIVQKAENGGVAEKFLQTDTPGESEIQKQIDIENLKADFEASEDQMEAARESFDTMIQCIKISNNIISGDNVPASDHKFLIDNDPELYMLSISSKVQKSDPEDKDKVINDEEDGASLSNGVPEQQDSAGSVESSSQVQMSQQVSPQTESASTESEVKE